ncbi:MAG: hypothetical protein JWM95_4165 [Gemmatimonadetes bacterium]|nr:hypothetical protein [Gemmatimonadota bacterium]
MRSSLFSALIVAATTAAAHAQAAVRSDTLKTPPLFRSETPLAVTFTANMKQLRGDKSETSPYRSATLSYVAADGKMVTLPIRVKTHGIWRLKHCDLPPLRLNISNKESKGTVFHDLQHPKVTSSCKDTDQYEQYALQEMQLYRIYQVVTPKSHRVRTLRITYVDSATAKPVATRYAFLFEDPDEMADRLGGKLTKAKGAGPDDIEPSQAAIAFLFEFLIGNTDFSFSGQHNVELIVKPDGTQAIPIAYDFDFSGAVNTSYATTDPKVPIKRVRDRLYRGYCTLTPEQPAAIALFQEKKPAIYALYHDDVSKLLKPDIVKETLEYFDEFYADIKDARDAEQKVFNACLGHR